ncbi:amidohydrolase family protein [Streptomyces cyanogenus]|uniref:Imidazolonepropionase n=1 Tax=Streptomyces cyanogenus TaxID=80860 RepID=A0ABX7TSW2_STRCY|nr:amidohydrolase family protein [Streptomyces cyanogenus]QTD99701.1 imidazolonepropionase [Streptomyces cyanogenus]
MDLTLIIENTAVVDVVTGTVRPGQDVHVGGGGTITAVTPHRTSGPGAPVAVPRLDGRGRYLLPGLVDSHVHIAFNGFLDVRPDFTRTLKQFLLHGVTSVVDFFTVGGDFPGSSPETVREDVNAGTFLGPRMMTSYGCLNAPGGFCDCSVGDAASAVVTRDDVDREMDRITRVRPDFVKIVYDDVFGTLPNLTKEMLGDLVRSAHDRGFRVAVHVASGAHALDAVEVGADIIGHGIVDDVPDRLVPQLVERGIMVIPTLASYEARSLERWRISLPAASPPEVVRRYAGTRKSLYETNGQLPLYREAFEKSLKALAHMVAEGVRVVAGSDAGTWYTFPGDSLLRELALYTEAGLSPAQALRTATSDAAAAWGFADDRGTVEVGKRADLLLVDANPLDDVSALRNPAAVVLGGRVLDLDELATDIVEGALLPAPEPAGEVPCSPHHLRGAALPEG